MAVSAHHIMVHIIVPVTAVTTEIVANTVIDLIISRYININYDMLTQLDEINVN